MNAPAPGGRAVLPSNDLVRAQARRIVTVARARFGADFGAVAANPCRALDAWAEVEFQLVPQPAVTVGLDGSPGEGCSVAGAYIDGGHAGPPGVPANLPVVQVAEAASPGRRSFTALHELGHHLQRTDIELAAVLWEQSALDLFEDMACNAFAAEVLLPEPAVHQVIGAKGPTAGEVVDLYVRSGASRSAVCVRAAQRLPAPGHVCLFDEDGNVFFSAPHGMPPLRKGSDQSRVDVVARGLRSGSSRGRARFVYRDGIEGEELFMQSANMSGFLVVVAVVDRAPWEGFVLPSREVGPRGSSYECADPACGATYVSFEPRCPRCSVAACTQCGRCSCTGVVTERTCTKCWLVKIAAGFDGDVCGDCA